MTARIKKEGVSREADGGSGTVLVSARCSPSGISRRTRSRPDAFSTRDYAQAGLRFGDGGLARRDVSSAGWVDGRVGHAERDPPQPGLRPTG